MTFGFGTHGLRNRRKLTYFASKHPHLVSVLFVLVLLGLEEWWFGIGYRHYNDTYHEIVYRPIDVRRTARNRQEIAIVSIVYDNSNSHDYVLAQRTTRCYARLHGYQLLEINLERDREYLAECPGKDFMFRRHCVMSKLMAERSRVEWFLFLDADMGVVNPNHLIEEYTNPRADLIFYDRLFNYEIMAGSYLARNSEFARAFLRHWAKYEERVSPDSFHGTDNGAIQEVFLDHFCFDCSSLERRRCTHIWRQSKSLKDLFYYESCTREILGSREWFQNANGTLRQLSNVRGYWARDCVHTKGRWSSDDFVMHMWKEKKRNVHIWDGWHSPFVADPDDSPAACDLSSTPHLNWKFKDTFVRPADQIRRQLISVFEAAYSWHLDRLKTVQRVYPIDQFGS